MELLVVINSKAFFAPDSVLWTTLGEHPYLMRSRPMFLLLLLKIDPTLQKLKSKHVCFTFDQT